MSDSKPDTAAHSSRHVEADAESRAHRRRADLEIAGGLAALGPDHRGNWQVEE